MRGIKFFDDLDEQQRRDMAADVRDLLAQVTERRAKSDMQELESRHLFITDVLGGLRGSWRSCWTPHSGRRWVIAARCHIESILEQLGFEVVRAPGKAHHYYVTEVRT